MSRTTHHRNQKWSWSTPSWWTKMHMIKPQRAKIRTWKKEVEKTPLEDIEDHKGCPHGNKPHVYYW